ncbi:arrestin homolog isoform X1 [Procambarus clarkii]|uniref:arrestin homolog isoform X1 n=1 Tax=Procambarus clarkii TaxID=6728 RepID=UPI0037433692
MGLRFCNEACLQAQQLWPVPEDDHHDHMNLTPLQDTLVKRLGAGAVPFTFTVSSLAPPSVTLLPARTYVGAPIGTNYDLRIFVGENPEDKPHKRSSIRMGMKLYQMASGAEVALPYAAASKPLLLADGQVEVEATLDKAVYERDEQVNVNVSVTNHSSRNVRRIKILVVQYVDVAMFSNGKFKNIVATLDTTDGCPITSGATLTRQFELQPARGPIKNWIALEEFYDRESALASSVVRPDAQERNVFAIYVSYYVKVKLFTSAIGGEVSVKVPFKLMRRHTVDDVATNTSPTTEAATDGAPITTSQSMFDLSTGDPRRGATKVRKSPPSRSTSEDSGRSTTASSAAAAAAGRGSVAADQGGSVSGHGCVDAETFSTTVQIEGTGRGRLVNSAC